MAKRRLLSRLGSAIAEGVKKVVAKVTRRKLTPEEKKQAPAPEKPKTQRTAAGIEAEKVRKRNRNRSKSSAVGQTKGSNYPARKQVNAAKRKAGGGQAKSAQRPQSSQQKKSAAQRAAEKTRSNATGKQKSIRGGTRRKKSF